MLDIDHYVVFKEEFKNSFRVKLCRIFIILVYLKKIVVKNRVSVIEEKYK